MLIARTSDPNFGRILEEQIRTERLQATRIFLLAVLAWVGILVWAAAVSPSPRPRIETIALFLWPACFGGFLLARALEYRAERRLRALLAAGASEEPLPAAAGDGTSRVLPVSGSFWNPAAGGSIIAGEWERPEGRQGGFEPHPTMERERGPRG